MADPYEAPVIDARHPVRHPLIGELVPIVSANTDTKF
jgi:hypothetical protein